MKAKRAFTIIALVIMSIIVLILSKKDLWDVHSALLENEVLSIGSSVKTVNLSELTPFDWDVAYSFDPYTSKDKIYETVGYKWDHITETVNEGMNQIVFLKDGKVVCYIYGYPENNGYGIYFASNTNRRISSASILTVEEDLTFQVTRMDEVIILKNN